MSRFEEKVVEIVSKVPFGRVVSYGQVAVYIGIPKAARQVGWILNRKGEVGNLPWWRVVNNTGRISIKGSKFSPEEQKRLLIREGVKVNNDLTLDIERYRFIPDQKVINALGLPSSYLEIISARIPFSNYFPKKGLLITTKKCKNNK